MCGSVLLKSKKGTLARLRGATRERVKHYVLCSCFRRSLVSRARRPATPIIPKVPNSHQSAQSTKAQPRSLDKMLQAASQTLQRPDDCPGVPTVGQLKHACTPSPQHGRKDCHARIVLISNTNTIITHTRFTPPPGCCFHVLFVSRSLRVCAVTMTEMLSPQQLRVVIPPRHRQQSTVFRDIESISS